MSNSYTPPGYYWGKVFKSFYGDPDWQKYLAESTTLPNPSSFRDLPFSSGRKLTSSEIARPFTNTFAHEVQLLVRSDLYNKISKKCCIDTYGMLSGIDLGTNYSSDQFTSVDVKKVGCRFSLDDVKAFLSKLSIDSSPEMVEHAWSLSNSCGELVDPTDKSRFIALTFKGREELLNSESFNPVSSYSDYLAYCLSLYDLSRRKSSVGSTQLLEDYVAYIRTYLATSDLRYRKAEDNPLITGILYDFCKENKVVLSDFTNNLGFFVKFKSVYLPLIEEIFIVKWTTSPPDMRLTFPLNPDELLVKVPLLNVIDSTVIFSKQLRLEEGYVEVDSILILEERIEALLIRDNPSLKTHELWVAFFCYYGEFRCGQNRVVARPKVYSVPENAGSYSVNFEGVEKFFDELQNRRKDINVRRRFNGARADVAFSIFKALNIGFLPITRLEIPQKYSYLNVDYYKHVKASAVNDEERMIICNMHKDIHQKCNDARVRNTVPRAQQGHLHNREKTKPATKAKPSIVTLHESITHGLRGRGQRRR